MAQPDLCITETLRTDFKGVMEKMKTGEKVGEREMAEMIFRFLKGVINAAYRSDLPDTFNFIRPSFYFSNSHSATLEDLQKAFNSIKCERVMTSFVDHLYYANTYLFLTIGRTNIENLVRRAFGHIAITNDYTEEDGFLEFMLMEESDFVEVY